MANAAPPLLSGLTKRLLRRPPSLRELAVVVGYAEDYAWFAGLVRRLFPDEAESVTSPSTPPTSSSGSTSGTNHPGPG